MKNQYLMKLIRINEIIILITMYKFITKYIYLRVIKKQNWLYLFAGMDINQQQSENKK